MMMKEVETETVADEEEEEEKTNRNWASRTTSVVVPYLTGRLSAQEISWSIHIRTAVALIILWPYRNYSIWSAKDHQYSLRKTMYVLSSKWDDPYICMHVLQRFMPND